MVENRTKPTLARRSTGRGGRRGEEVDGARSGEIIGDQANPSESQLEVRGGEAIARVESVDADQPVRTNLPEPPLDSDAVAQEQARDPEELLCCPFYFERTLLFFFIFFMYYDLIHCGLSFVKTLSISSCLRIPLYLYCFVVVR